MLSRCPVCSGAVHVTEIACGECGTKVQSAFETCRFCRLSLEQLEFVELFLRNRGNLTSVGDDLDISYPTVTRRLDAVLAALHPSAPAPAAPVDEPEAGRRDEDRRLILEMLDRGEISADEATRQLQDL
jgi:hypothetical protein